MRVEPWRPEREREGVLLQRPRCPAAPVDARVPRSLGRERRARLRHLAGSARVPGLGGARPHRHRHGRDAGCALPRRARARARIAPAGGSRSTATVACSDAGRERGRAGQCHVHGRRRSNAERGVPRLPQGALPWSVPFQVWMPYAAYFVGGIATHEYPVVPSSASHGCVRLPAGRRAACIASSTSARPCTSSDGRSATLRGDAAPERTSSPTCGARSNVVRRSPLPWRRPHRGLRRALRGLRGSRRAALPSCGNSWR